MAPVVTKIEADPKLKSITCVTGQHRSMLDQVLDLFDITPDYDLSVMEQNQNLNRLLVRVVEKIDDVLMAAQPDCVLVHGDTTTALAASLAAFHRNIKVGHVEAGLRTYNLAQPWPEEFNRRIVDISSSYLFAPTQKNAENLKSEKTNGQIFITGNTVIDALKQIVDRIKKDPKIKTELCSKFSFLDPSRRLLLVTGHRRESFGAGFSKICTALKKLSLRDDLQIVYPVHLNPNVRGPVYESLSGLNNVHLIDPQEYLAFVYLMSRADIILTDSGGVQEEAPSLGKPVLVMRDVTERPEAASAGIVKLVGLDVERITAEVARLLDDPSYYRSISRVLNPYGDGLAAQRICAVLSGETPDPFSFSNTESIRYEL